MCTIDHAVRIVRLAPVIARLSMKDREARRIVSMRCCVIRVIEVCFKSTNSASGAVVAAGQVGGSVSRFHDSSLRDVEEGA